MSDTPQDEIDFAMPTLRKIAQTTIPMERAIASLKTLGKGTFAPLYQLRLKAVPRFGRQWMANVTTARFEIDAEAYLAELDAMAQA